MGIFREMLCPTHTQLPLAGLEEKSAESPALQPKPPPPEETVASVDDRPRLDKKDYMKKWRQEHPDKVREHARRSWKKNGWKENLKRRQPEFKPIQRKRNHEKYLRHKEQYAAKNLEWARKNKEKSREIKRRWREKNAEVCRKRSLEAYYNNLDKYRSREWLDKHNAYVASKRRQDPQFLIAQRLRATMHQAIRRQFSAKAQRTRELLGCSVAELKAHLESQFTNEMSWENRRSFVIDHFVPCAAFDLTNPEEQRWAFNWRNLRPMPHHDNQVKSDTIPDPLPDWLPLEIRQRIIAQK